MELETEVEMLLSYAQNAPDYFIWLLNALAIRKAWLNQSKFVDPVLSTDWQEYNSAAREAGQQAEPMLKKNYPCQEEAFSYPNLPDQQESLIENFLALFDKDDILAYCANKLPTNRSKQLEEYRKECAVCEEIVQGYYLLLKDFGNRRQVDILLAEKKRER